MADKEEKKEGGGGGGGGSKLLLILVAVNCLLSAGALAVALLRPGAAKAPAAHAEVGKDGARAESPGEKGDKRDERAGPGPTLKLPDFVVHLRDPEVDRYAKLTIEVEVENDKAKEALTARMPQVRDAFIAYLSDRTTADLRGSEAIARAKVELAERLRGSAPGVGVKGLYMTDLVVQ
ncbi:MAG: flagellar basal body-associated FliL family protein [Deltaproteobacteria bacterium]|nr:flagellar basal body-associated FliL family protein [Deltaproteobacteria bacterium]